MVMQNKSEALAKTPFFRGLDEAELSHIASHCSERTYAVGEICQTEGQPGDRVNIILKGRAGAVVRIPNISYVSSEIIIDSLVAGDVFGWSSLIKTTPWSTLRVIESMDVLYIGTLDLLKLCENNNHIGYVVMKNLASLIASRLRRNRMSTLNALVAIKGL
jgi:CRP-like cAMP-binding protein